MMYLRMTCVWSLCVMAQWLEPLQEDTSCIKHTNPAYLHTPTTHAKTYKFTPTTLTYLLAYTPQYKPHVHATSYCAMRSNVSYVAIIILLLKGGACFSPENLQYLEVAK